MLYQRQNIGGSQMRIGPTDAFTNKPILVFTGGADTDHPSQLDQDIVAWLTDQAPPSPSGRPNCLFSLGTATR